MTENGHQQDAEQQQKATEAARREPTSFDLSALPAWVESAQGAWIKRRAELNCTPCVLDSDGARRCSFRGQEEICKHAATMRAQDRRRELEAAMSGGLVPLPYREKILAGKFEDRRAIAAVRQFVGRRSRFMILAGGNGAGKTLALCLAVAYRKGLFVPAWEFDPYGKEADELVATCMEVSVLAIDDAGAGRSTSKVCQARIEQVLCGRYDAGKDTIVSTNLVKKSFGPLYGGNRLLDRLNADPLGWIPCLEESLRATPPEVKK
jgi:DNA replication protein DnaC